MSYTGIWNETVRNRLARRLAIESAKPLPNAAQETAKSLDEEYCPDCAMYDDATDRRESVKCPLCGRAVCT